MGRRGRRRLREVEAAVTRDEARATFWGAPVLDGPSTVGPMTLAELQDRLDRSIAGRPSARVQCGTRAEADELFERARRAVESSGVVLRALSSGGVVLLPTWRVRAPSDGAG